MSEAEHDGKWNCATLLYLSGDSLCINSIKSISVSIKNISCQKSDGDLVGLSSYEEAGPVGHVAARVSVAGYFSSETAQDSLKFSMVPCKQTSAPTSPNNFINFKESDSNGNDIRKVNNFGDIYIYISIHSISSFTNTKYRRYHSHQVIVFNCRSDKNLSSPGLGMQSDKTDVSRYCDAVLTRYIFSAFNITELGG